MSLYVPPSFSASQALPRPAPSCPALPVQQNCSQFPEAGTSQEAAQGKLLSPGLPRAGHSHPSPGATPGTDCALGGLSLVESSKEHLPDLPQLVGSFQERGVRSPPAPSPCTSWRRHGHGWIAKLKRCPVYFLLGQLSPSVSCSARVAAPGRLLVTALGGREGEPSLLGGLRVPCPQRIAQPGMLCRRSASPEWSRLRAARGTSEQTCLCPSKGLRCVRQPPAQQRQRKQLGWGGGWRRALNLPPPGDQTRQGHRPSTCDRISVGLPCKTWG